jgi:hypothetical protein
MPPRTSSKRARVSARIANESGAAILLFTITIAVGLVAVYATMSISDILAEQNADYQLNLALSARLFAANISQTLGQPLAWQQMKANTTNAALYSCFVTGGGSGPLCTIYETPVTPPSIYVIYNDTGTTPIFDGTNSNNGFDHAGRSCAQGSPWSCPFRVALTWTADCTTTPCTAKIVGTVTVNPSVKLPFNTSKYVIQATD